MVFSSFHRWYFTTTFFSHFTRFLLSSSFATSFYTFALLQSFTSFLEQFSCSSFQMTLCCSPPILFPLISIGCHIMCHIHSGTCGLPSQKRSTRFYPSWQP